MDKDKAKIAYVIHRSRAKQLLLFATGSLFSAICLGLILMAESATDEMPYLIPGILVLLFAAGAMFVRQWQMNKVALKIKNGFLQESEAVIDSLIGAANLLSSSTPETGRLVDGILSNLEVSSGQFGSYPQEIGYIRSLISLFDVNNQKIKTIISTSIRALATRFDHDRKKDLEVFFSY